MALPTGITGTYRVRFDESGPDGCLPPSGFLRYAQDLAWVHSAGAGFGRHWYAERGLTWLVRGIELEINGPVAYGERLDVSTRVLGFRRVWARRRSEFRNDGEPPLATATIDWVLLNAAGQPARIPPEILDAFAGPAAAFGPLRVRLGGAPGDASRREFKARRSELDPLAHVNNAAYLDYLDEQLAECGHEDRLAQLPRRYTVEFVLPAESATPLVAHAWEDGIGLSYRLESAEGQELVRARLDCPSPKMRS